MALINCPECNNQVSDTALTCPHCGYQLKKAEVKTPTRTVKKKQNRGCGIVLLTLAAVALLMLGYYLIKVYLPDKKSTSAKTITNSTSNVPIVNQYTKQYAGGYTIEVKGYSGTDVEAYALRKDGTATWMWIEPDGKGGAVTKQSKTGTWTATATKIIIKINGNTGISEEEYVLQNGVFVCTLSNDRYLKPSK